MKVIVVDDQDNVIGLKERGKITSKDIYRVSALWLFNKKSETLLAKRALTKAHDPDKWGPAVAGTVEEGETYDSNIKKEMEEEIGIKNLKLKGGSKERVVVKHHFFVQHYFAKLDLGIDGFNVSKREVAEIRWFGKEELQKLLKKQPEIFIGPIGQMGINKIWDFLRK